MANKKRIFGFVVYCEQGLFHLASAPKKNRDGRLTRHGTLWFGGPATVFDSKRAAYRALDRTKRYRDEGFWPWFDSARVHSVGKIA
jgi:hypothetical protein